MKYLLLLLMFMFSLKECTLHTKHIKDYKPQKFIVDENIPIKSMKLIDVIKLEENEDVIVSTISAIDIGRDNNFIITNEANRTAVLYNYENGRIIKSIFAGQDLADSVAMSGVKPYLIVGKQLRYVKSDEYKNKGLTDKGIEMIKSYYTIPAYSDNGICFLSLLYLLASSDTERYNSIDNRTVIIYFNNDLKYQKLSFLEVNEKSYPVPYYFEILKNTNIVISSTNFDLKKKSFDSLVTTAVYDKSGKFLYNIGYLPELYKKNNLVYQEKWRPLLTCIDDSIFMAYPRDLDIYGPGQKVWFRLKNLPFSNDSGMAFVTDFYRLTRIQERNPDPKELGNLLPITIIYTFNSNGNYGIVLLVFDKEHPMGFYYIAQEYDLKGNLLSQTRIYDEPGNQIRNFVFDKYNSYLCIVSKNKDGWTLEKRKW